MQLPDFDQETRDRIGGVLSAGPLFERIQPQTVRYIKLGRNGRWETQSLDEGRIYWSISADPLEEAAAGDWAAAERRYRADITTPSVATSYLRELREFFTLPADTLWITFARGQMWWCFSGPAELVGGELTEEDAAAFRPTIGPWRNHDRFGRVLDQASLSTKLTQLAAYRQSICTVKHADYAIRRINGDEEAGVGLLRAHREALIDTTASVIADLHWRDFELLVDLIFSSAGWRRVSEVGGTMKDIDLLLEQPITGERVSVQVKSRLDQKVADTCVETFNRSANVDRFFLIYHTGNAVLRHAGRSRPMHLWDCAMLAERAVDAGLTSWLAGRAG